MVVGYLLLACACDRQANVGAKDTVAVTPPLPDTAVTEPAPPVASAWDSAGGPVFLVMSATGTMANVIVPSLDSTTELDTVRLQPGPERTLSFDLFQLGRRVGSASVSGVLEANTPTDCSAWRAVRLGGVTDSTAWSVAFAKERFDPVPIDSIAGLSAADSARLSRDVARMASGAPGDTTDALKGIPFVVRRAWLLSVSSERRTILAEVVRSLNQEASPTHEQLVLIAEQDSTGPRNMRLAFSSRMVGGEESLESIEILTAGTWRGRSQPVALLARYLGDGVVYGLLTRQTDGRWTMSWVSPYAGC